MKPKITIRKAVKADMRSVHELITELAVFEKEPQAVEVTIADLQRDGFGEHPLFTCFVAEINENVEGMALVYFRYSTWKGKTVHLEDLVVREAMRGNGLGNALFKKVLEFAEKHKVKRTEWVVLDWNKNAIKFYERSGATILKDWFLVQMNDKQIRHYFNN